jgi:hypothetical protein
MLTLTAPGAAVLPWDTDLCKIEGPHRCSGHDGCRVEYIYRTIFEHTAQARASRLFEAAQRSADRWVRRQWGGQLPRQLANARAPQLRGVAHFHYLLPKGSEVEKAWSRHVERFIAAAARRERALSPDAVWAAIEREYMTGEITRGVYGFGFSHPGRKASLADRARYLARNAAGYVGGQAGRHYVSRRLTDETGVTMRVLRACNWLFVRRKMIAAGEVGADDWVPGYWSDEWKAQVLGVFGLVSAARAP